MIQTPACDRCTQGVMDATNSHYLGLCQCECHKSVYRPWPWHVINGEELRELLRRAHAGEDPETLYIEAYVNAEKETE